MRKQLTLPNLFSTTILIASALAVVSISDTRADSESPLTDLVLGEKFASENGLSLRGWLSGGISTNNHGTRFNGPISFNDRADEFTLNQAYLIAERSVDRTASEFDLGGRVDLNFGTDSVFTTALGFDDEISSSDDLYKLAIPQAYLETFLPVGNGLSIKVGHFYTTIGYEVVTAPDNFFYSHAYTMQYGEPFTHTGVLASYSVSDSVSITGGITRGWDNFSESGKNESFLGAVAWSQDDTSLTFSLTTGEEAPGLNRTMYSAVLAHQITDSLKYVLQHDYGYSEAGSAVSAGANAHWYGINQYLTYSLNDEVSLGARAEWFRDDDGARVLGVRSGAGGGAADYYALTVGANYNPCPYLRVRPEVRFDYQDQDSPDVAEAFDNGASNRQVTAAVDVIISF